MEHDQVGEVEALHPSPEDLMDFSQIQLSTDPLPEPSIPVDQIDQAVVKALVERGRMTGEQAKALLREERRKRRLAERGY